jgi:predicted Fe-S protein YdhL (DUF1289 family)
MTPATRRLLARGRALRASGESPVPSPCTSVCRVHPDSGLCQGCWRTLDEIADWGALDDSARRTVWLRLEQRAAGPQETA